MIEFENSCSFCWSGDGKIDIGTSLSCIELSFGHFNYSNEKVLCLLYLTKHTESQ